MKQNKFKISRKLIAVMIALVSVTALLIVGSTTGVSGKVVAQVKGDYITQEEFRNICVENLYKECDTCASYQPIASGEDVKFQLCDCGTGFSPLYSQVNYIDWQGCGDERINPDSLARYTIEEFEAICEQDYKQLEIDLGRDPSLPSYSMVGEFKVAPDGDYYCGCHQEGVIGAGIAISYERYKFADWDRGCLEGKEI